MNDTTELLKLCGQLITICEKHVHFTSVLGSYIDHAQRVALLAMNPDRVDCSENIRSAEASLKDVLEQANKFIKETV